MDSKSIKSAFLDYFRTQDHKIISGASLLPRNDPSLLFINSGMAPMKPYFTGAAQPPHPRLANVQACIRTNDIDDVGDMHHLTLFEMLGSWSINDYYKEEAVEFAYDLLTKGLGLDPAKLYVSVYSGNVDKGLDYDRTSHDAWLAMGVPESRIVAFGDEDNFWGPAGTEGPCGPCTEVFIDTGTPGDETSYEATGKFDTQKRYVEIWNAGVFMELYKDQAGNFTRLKQHNVDTGAGLERLTMAINGLSNVYETDIYTGLNSVIANAASKSNLTTGALEAKRVLADHVRAASFIISEGVFPDKNKEGYIPRRLIRRAVAASSKLGIESFPYADAIDAVIEYSGNDYPVLKERADFIKSVVEQETTSFSKILKQGERALLKVIRHESSNGISGMAAFNLTASHGIPLDILITMAEQQGRTIDIAGYNAAMDQHKEMSRKPA